MRACTYCSGGRRPAGLAAAAAARDPMASPGMITVAIDQILNPKLMHWIWTGPKSRSMPARRHGDRQSLTVTGYQAAAACAVLVLGQLLQVLGLVIVNL